MEKRKPRLDLLSILVRIVIVCVLLFVGIKSYQWVSLNKTFKQMKQEEVIYEEQIIQLYDKIEESDTDFFIEKMLGKNQNLQNLEILL